MDASPPPRPRKPRRRWRWHVPPALVHGGESLEGAQVLDEVQGPLGLLLWETYRDVALWAATDPELREGLFAAGAAAARRAAMDAAGADPALERALRGAAVVLADPAGAQEQEVMAACRQAADWAEQRGLLATAVTLATAAALASPAHAGAAFRVGQIARRKGEGARAETWFRRAVGLGRQAKDWLSYSEAFLGLGNLYKQRGNYPAARRFHIRGLRAARRHALRDVQGRALHDLFTIAVETSPPAEAEELARLAFRAYGPRHPKLPVLAHDVAYFWMSQGRFEPALEVFRAVLPHLHDTGERILCAGNVGRAAGAVGNRAVFDEAWEQVWGAQGEWEKQALAPQALLELAHGASSLRDWARAERAAETARELGQRRGSGQVVIETDAVLDAARRKRGLEQPAASAAAEDTQDLAADFVRSLRTAGSR
ncbi:MAG: tetratricopeptide repeat protein [Gemmatimonadetes bacterium]|nr:tetratricopeptide repeat protein [Gemmatimonadota bacterium]